MRLAWTLAVLLALAGGAPAAAEADRFGDGGVPAFYRWPGPVPEPGTLLRSEALPVDLVPSGAARGERILYASTDGLDGRSRCRLCVHGQHLRTWRVPLRGLRGLRRRRG